MAYYSLGYKKRRKRRKITDEEKDKLQEQFLRLYRKEGMSMNQAAKKVGFSRFHVYKWAETDPEFAAEFEELRFIKKNKTQAEWDERHKHDDEYKKKFLEVYANPEHSTVSALEEVAPNLTTSNLQYWQKTDKQFKLEYKKLQRLTRPRMADRVEIQTAVNQTKMEQKQQKFLQVFRENVFSVTKACEAMGINRAVITDWKKKFPDFRSALMAIEEEKLDFIEDALFDEISNKNIAAIIFAAKCKLKERGYIEQPQQKTLTIEHKYDKATIDAVVRGAQLDRGAYYKLLGIDKPDTIDAEYEEIE